MAAGVAGSATALNPDQQPNYARVIVRFKQEASTVKARPLAARATATEAADVAQVRGTTLGLRHDMSLRARRSLDTRTHVYTATGMSSVELARRLAADGEVESVEVDRWWRHYSVPNDPLYATAAAGGVTAGQWYLKAPDSTVVSSINAPSAWDTATGTGVVVAVLDTGARLDHPDLAGQFLPGYDVIGFSNSSSEAIATANDGNGADSDPSDPGDWVSQADIDSGRLGTSCTKDDIANSSWHGTRVSGLIAAATNNGLGMAGVAYNAKILPVRVLGKCGGWQSDIDAGMRWAAGLSVPGLPANPNPAKVINMSLGSDGSCSSTYQSAVNAVTTAGVTVVAAAGNGVDNTDPTKAGGIGVGTPANCANVIGVAGLRHAGTKVGFSNLGPQVSISAPGGNCVNATGACLYAILSTSNSGTTTPVAADNAYNYTGVGTSFSTPLVSGTVALMLSINASLTPAQIRSTLMSTARAFPAAAAGVAQCVAGNSTTPQQECNCTTSTCGAGMLDANAAVKAVVPTSTTPPTTPTASPAPPATSSGGGGAMSGLWLAALALAAIALRWPKRSISRR
ncbi:hypothetical protein CDN99_22145 [Roseateles aquatilis]|uniref:Peptidase S8/S53 domain-containing protein n=2 Tax=Roseateles aquatilis TaxID=431061 RepID=A0A2D0AM93_9BURK|nr:hypothetical protein CDN99_22145 [Roseateles aquatilis]